MLEIFNRNLQEALDPLALWVRQFGAQVFGPSERRDLLWLAVGLVSTDLVYRLWNRPKSESFWSYAAPWRIYFHQSAILDYKFLLVQKIVTAFVVGPMLISALWRLGTGKFQDTSLMVRARAGVEAQSDRNAAFG